jgi:phage shock protein C
MYCSKCGSPIGNGARFCSACGAPAVPGIYPPVSRLMRPREGRVIAGVCAAFAIHYDWDVTIVRLILVLCVLFAGTGILAYVIAWIVIPEAPYALPPQNASSTTP